MASSPEGGFYFHLNSYNSCALNHDLSLCKLGSQGGFKLSYKELFKVQLKCKEVSNYRAVETYKTHKMSIQSFS